MFYSSPFSCSASIFVEQSALTHCRSPAAKSSASADSTSAEAAGPRTASCCRLPATGPFNPAPSHSPAPAFLKAAAAATAATTTGYVLSASASSPAASTNPTAGEAFGHRAGSGKLGNEMKYARLLTEF